MLQKLQQFLQVSFLLGISVGHLKQQLIFLHWCKDRKTIRPLLSQSGREILQKQWPRDYQQIQPEGPGWCHTACHWLLPTQTLTKNEHPGQAHMCLTMSTLRFCQASCSRTLWPTPALPSWLDALPPDTSRDNTSRHQDWREKRWENPSHSSLHLPQLWSPWSIFCIKWQSHTFSSKEPFLLL